MLAENYSTISSTRCQIVRHISQLLFSIEKRDVHPISRENRQKTIEHLEKVGPLRLFIPTQALIVVLDYS